MLLVSAELTLPESHRSGLSSCAALDATRISYADCLPPDSRQLRFGVASPTPIGLLNVSTRSVVGVTFPPAESAGATVLIASGTAPMTASEAAKRPMTLVLKFSSLVFRRRDRTKRRDASRRGKSPGFGRSRVFPGREARNGQLRLASRSIMVSCVPRAQTVDQGRSR